MRARPILLRLIGPFAVMIVLVLGVCFGVIYYAGQKTIERQQTSRLLNLRSYLQQFIPADARDLTPDQQRRLAESAVVLGSRVTLYSAGSVAIFDSSNASPKPDADSSPELLDARRGGIATTVREVGTYLERRVFIATALDDRAPEGVLLRIDDPYTRWADYATPPGMILLAAVGSSILVMIWLSILLHRLWIGPVRNMAVAASKMAAGEWQTRVEPRGDDELYRFAGKLNLLAAEAQKQLNALRVQRADLQALVDSLPDPVILVDEEGRIALLNTPAARLLQIAATTAMGKPFIHVVTDEVLVSLYEYTAQGANGAEPMQPLPTQSPRELRLQRNGQRVTFQALGVSTKAGGALLVLRNVSAMAGAVQMKTDFVANASHELRTPIAAIKIAMETLREVFVEDPDQTARCINIVDDHVHRLEDMLSDLLDLSRVESPDLKPRLAPVKVDDIFAPLRATLQPMATRKSVELILGDDIHGSIVFESDRRLMNLILRNLIENAIKFTPPRGAVDATISLDYSNSAGPAETHAPRIGAGEESLIENLPTGAPGPEPEPERPDVIAKPGGRIILTVSDTGCGIPAEHQERVFERFYQVDAARSGSAGRGTGLGLAIVRHAVQALGGSVALKSTVGVGTTVTCVFPIVSSAPSKVGAGAVI